ncbi:Uncharacterised protein [Sphingobacterium daejeonense]|nr:Uncharacterised protein [Sphingobacterium daejeonense]
MARSTISMNPGTWLLVRTSGGFMATTRLLPSTITWVGYEFIPRCLTMARSFPGPTQRFMSPSEEYVPEVTELFHLCSSRSTDMLTNLTLGFPLNRSFTGRIALVQYRAAYATRVPEVIYDHLALKVRIPHQLTVLVHHFEFEERIPRGSP